MECQKKFKLITTALIGLGAAAVTTQVLAIQQADHSVIRIGGLVQTDFFTYNEPVFGDGADIRRANAFARGNLDDDWSVQLAINPANSGNILDDSFVGYAGLSPVWLAVGRITPAFGMDAWTSGANTTFMERAAVSTLFAPPSGVGLYAEGDTGMVAFQAAAFAPDHNTNRGTGSALYDFNDPWGYTARVIFNPARDPGYVLHLGASYNYQDFKNSETFGGNFVSNPELYSRQGASSLGAVNADTEAADFAEVYGGELAGAWGPFLVQGEYQKYHLNALTGFSDMDWTGWYLQASWVITCEPRPYDYVSGVFGNVKPTRAVIGAWEVAARYSDLDLSDDPAGGWTSSSQRGEMQSWTLGVNWYATENVKMQLNWTNSDNNYVTATDDLSVNALGLRAQVMF